jgi:hypothetical protein
MLAQTCQITRRYPGISCQQPRAGFLLRTDESPSAIYREGIVVCKGHGLAMEGEEGNGDYVTMSELADLMNDEERKAHTTIQPEDRDMTTTAAVPTMDQHNRMDLGQLAVMVNSRNAESRPVLEPKVIAVPRASEEPAPDVQDLGRVKSEEEVEEDELKRQMAALKAQLDAKKRARIDREKAEAEAKRAEAEAAKRAKALEQDANYQFSQAAQLRAYLMLHGGSSTMHAVETLLDAGVLTVRAGALVVRNGAGAVRAPRESTAQSSEPRVAPAKDPEYEAKKEQYKVLRRRGMRSKDIAEQLGVSINVIAGWTTRYPVVVGQPA